MSGLRNIREYEKEIDRILSEMQQLEKPWTPTATEVQAVCISSINATSGEGERWKLVTSGTKRKTPALPKGLQLQNRFTALRVEEVQMCLQAKELGYLTLNHA